MGPRISRRSAMIWLGGLMAAEAALAGIGLRRTEVPERRTACEGGDAMPRVLVAHATRDGSTAEVAERVGQRLCAQGLSAEVRPVEQVPDLAGYDAAVLESGTCYASWLGAMTSFVEAQAEALERLPVAFFPLHMLHLGDTPEARAERARYTAAARAAVPPIEEAFFAGRVDPSRLSLVDRLAVRMVNSPRGDQRDWPRIEAWADALPAKLFPT